MTHINPIIADTNALIDEIGEKIKQISKLTADLKERAAYQAVRAILKKRVPDADMYLCAYPSGMQDAVNLFREDDVGARAFWDTTYSD